MLFDGTFGDSTLLAGVSAAFEVDRVNKVSSGLYARTEKPSRNSVHEIGRLWANRLMFRLFDLAAEKRSVIISPGM